MNRRQQARAVVKGVRHHWDVVDGGERKDFAQFADASHLGRARLNKVHCPGGQQALEIHQRVNVLAGRDRNAARLPQLRETVKILWRPERLLQPFQVNPFEFFRYLARLVQRPGTIDVEGQFDVGTGFLAGGANGRKLYLRKFKRAKSCFDRRPNGGANKRRLRIADQARIAVQFGRPAAKKLAQRRIGGLSHDIPKGDVDRRDGKGKGAAPPKDVHLLLDRQHQRLDPRCVLADTKRRNQLVDGELGGSDCSKPEGLAPPDQSLVRHDLDEHESAAGSLLSPQAEASDLVAASNEIRNGKAAIS